MHTVPLKSSLNSVRYNTLLSLTGKKTHIKPHLGSLQPRVSLQVLGKKGQTSIHHICSLPEIYSLKLSPDTENSNKSRKKKKRQEREEKQPSIFYTKEKATI